MSHKHSSARKQRKRESEERRIRQFLSKYKKDIIKVLILLAIALLIFLFIKWDENRDRGHSEDVYEDEKPMISYNGKWYVQRDDIESIMVFGIDKYAEDTQTPDDAFENTQQNDYNAVLIIDNTAKEYKILQINRDTMTEIKHLGLNSEITGTQVEQLALAHTTGSGRNDSSRNVKDTVENLLYGTEIDHYIGFTMDAVPEITDACDGVPVVIKDDFSAINRSFIKGQEVTLTKDNVMDFIQARKSITDDPTNINRMARHKTYVESLRKVAHEKIEESTTWALKTLDRVKDYLSSDYALEDMARSLQKLSDYEFKGVMEIEGTVKYDRYAEFYPDEEKLTELVIKNFYGEKK